MKKTIGVFMMAAVLGLVAVESSEAQVSVGIGAGPAFADGSTGFNAQLSLGMGMGMLPVGLRIDGLWAQWPSEGTGNDRVLAGIANAELAFPGVFFSPYFLAGAGVYNTDVQHGNHRDQETGLGFNAGLGARFGLAGLGAFAETRVHFIRGDHENIQLIPITVGIRF
jgi:hypothetical protein